MPALSKDDVDKMVTSKPGESKDAEKKARKEAASRLLELAKPERLRVTMGLISLLVNSVTNLSFPWILGEAVDRADDPNYALFIGGTAGVFTIGSLASWVRIYCLGTSTERISSRLRKQLFNSYMDKDIAFFDSNKQGELSVVLEKDVSTAAEALTDKFAAGLRSINASVNGSILLFRSSPELCGVSLAIVPFVGVGAMTVRKYSKKLKDKLRALEGQVLSFALERYNRISTVRLNGQEENEKEKYSAFIDDSYDLASKSYFAQGSFTSFVGMMTNVSLMAVLFYGGRLLGKGKMTAGGLTRFAIQSAFVGLGFSGLSTFYGDMTRSLDAAARVFAMIDENEKHKAKKGEEGNSGDVCNAAADSAAAADKAVSVQNVCFAYPLSPDVTVLHDISLDIASTGLVAIVGASGAGKSTLLSLISGLYQASQGSIFVCGKKVSADESEASRVWLQDKVSVVQQNTGLLSGSAWENIAYGRRGKNGEASMRSVVDNEVKRAARQARAEDFITKLPNGYNTDIGEDGGRLSGGQRARLALARALAKEPAVLLLDEVTSALDSTNEKEIVSLLQALSKTKSVVVFTHSEQLMKAADVVHIVSEGRLVQSGKLSDVRSALDFDME